MGYHKRFFDNLAEKIYKNIDLYRPDVTLVSIEDGSRRKCHSIILSASSDYFSNVFNWDTSSPLLAELEVHHGITGETIDIVIKYIYSGEINLDLDNVNDLLVAANYFQIPEIVDLCTSFITQNLDVTTCIDILLFSWQLDLVKLMKEISIFIAQNFSSLLYDDSLKEKIVRLPLDALLVLLNSDKLTLRHPKTKLLTRPVEREKLVFEFIIEYCQQLILRSEDVDLLFSCVKWPLMNIFGQESFVLEQTSSLKVKYEGMQDKLKELYAVTHSDWFTSNKEYSSAGVDDKLMYGTRIFSCSELVYLDPMAGKDEITREKAGSNRATLPPKSFEYIASENQFISKLVIITRAWDGRTVISGISIYLSSGTDIVRHHAGMTAESGLDVHDIDLKDGEHIIGVKGKSGWLVDSLTFESSEERTFGPFGGSGGSKIDLMATLVDYHDEGGLYDYDDGWVRSVAYPGPHARIPLDSVLVGITGKEVTTADQLAITHLRFVFRAMLPTTDYLIRTDKKTERQLPFSNVGRLTPESESDFYDDDGGDPWDGFGGYGGYVYDDDDGGYHVYDFAHYDNDYVV